jgi:hypothetical protein
MNSLVSPFKLFSENLNYFKIGSNKELGDELRSYFTELGNDDIWKLVTNRQRLTHALRFTETIHLYALKDLPAESDTTQANQWMDIQPLKQADIDVFKKAIAWFKESLLSTGAEHVEFGRIFVSKLAAKSTIDTHTDSGKYFSYYDRFHFTVTAADKNVFIIKDEECILNRDSLYWVNNHVTHWLENRSNEDRINFILDARLS